MNIKIGNGNKIKNSHIGSNYNDPNKKNKTIKDHPLIYTIVGGIIVSVIMLFSFWENIVLTIENFLK